MAKTAGNTTFALAGYGRFGRHHANVLSNHPSAQLEAIAEPNQVAAEQARKAYPEAVIFDNPFRMLEEMEVDAVSIVSTEETHAGIVRKALENRIHVFCEKPLSTRLDEARELVGLAHQQNIQLRLGYILRYEPRHRVLQEQVQSGRLGKLAVIRAKRDASRSWFEAYGHRVHPVYETLVHDVDLVLWISQQRCRHVTAWGGHHLGFEVPDTFVMVMEMDDGALCTLESAWLAPAGAPANIIGWGEDEQTGKGVVDAWIEVLGTKGSSFLKTYEPSLTINDGSASYFPDLAFWPEVDGRTMGALREELWDFVQTLRGDPAAGVDSLKDALHVQEICEAAIEAEQSGFKVQID